MAHRSDHCRSQRKRVRASLLGAAEGRPHVDAALRAGTKLLVAHAHDAAVDGARHAVHHLHVELRQHEGRVDARVADVALGGRIDHVPDLEALDGLVLGHAAAA
eukprot:7114645-Heterocapsa_arctica.AAC.1